MPCGTPTIPFTIRFCGTPECVKNIKRSANNLKKHKVLKWTLRFLQSYRLFRMKWGSAFCASRRNAYTTSPSTRKRRMSVLCSSEHNETCALKWRIPDVDSYLGGTAQSAVLGLSA